MNPLRRRPRYAQPLARRLDRRTFTRAAGVGLIAAPFLRLLRSDEAEAAPGSAKRMFVMVTGGTSVPDWKMTGSSSDRLVTNTWNDGLERVKDKCVVVENLRGIGGHGVHQALLQTAHHWNGDSIDRVVADYLVESGVTTSIPSLLLGADVDDNSSYFRNAGSVPPVTSPTAALELVFGGFDPSATVDEEALAATLAKKKSMLDAVRGDLNQLHGMLGTEERPKLEAHLESLRQYEMRLTSDAPSGAGCELPVIEDSNDPVTIAKSHMLLARATFACDISRVVGVAWGQDNRFGINLPEIGVVADMHSLNHNANVFEEFRKWESWCSHEFADFVELLSSTPDPESGGMLLDSTIVCWARAMGDAVNHSSADSRLVFAGGPTVLETGPDGRHVDAAGAPYRSGLACMAQAVGQTDTSATDGQSALSGVLA